MQNKEYEKLPRIKECPFCGGYSTLARKSKTVVKGELRYNTYVYCVQCGARGGRVLLDKCDTPHKSREEAISRWNNRKGI